MSGLIPITVNTPPGEEAHIRAEDDASIYQSIFGEDGVSTVGQACKATVLSNNKVRIADGIICVGGHFARIPYGDYIDCEIDSGQSEKKRNDIIVARFESTGTGGIDTYTCEVKKGTAGSTATDPEIVQEDLYKAGKVRELPLYRVKIEGLSITAVEQLFTLRKTNEELEKELESLNSNFKVYTKSITSKPWASINSDNYETRKYRRIGNLIMLEYLANFNTDGTLSFNLIEQSIPQGYRPVTTVYLPFVQTSGANVIGHGRLRLSPDGTSYMSLTEPGFTEHGGTMMYFTNDPFPKD